MYTAAELRKCAEHILCESLRLCASVPLCLCGKKITHICRPECAQAQA